MAPGFASDGGRELFGGMRSLPVVALVAAAGVGWIIARQPPDERASTPAPAVDTVVFDTRVDSLARLRAERWEWARGFDSYLHHMVLADTLRMVRRWPDRTMRPLRVWFDRDERASAESVRAIREAFGMWRAIGSGTIPVIYDFASDSAGADVVVRWVQQLPDGRAGRADIVFDSEGWIRSGTLTLAVGDEVGGYRSEALYTIALHEIGHLLGLGHSDHADDVMYPETRIRELSARDRTTARLLYTLPPGSLTD